MDAKRWSVPAAVAVTVLAWASAFVVIRHAGEHYAPGPLSLGRLLVGALVLGALLLRQRWVAPTRREWLLLVLCGLAWFGVYNVALNAAERHLDAGTAAMLVNIGPILIAIFAGLLLGEGLPRWLGIGAAVAFAGVLVIGLSSAEREADVVGVLLVVVAAVTYAIGVVSQKPVLRRLPALQVTFIACAIGAVSCLPFAVGLVRATAEAPAGAIAELVYLGAVPTAFAFTTWAYALARTDAGRLGVTTYLVPPLTIAMAALLLGEAPAALALVGGALCLVGVSVSRRGGRAPVPVRSDDQLDEATNRDGQRQ